jgi:glycerophosphoryl diester phosphodiesterase
VDLLRDEGYLDRAVIQAFEAETLASVLAIAPDAETCWLTGPWQLDAGSVPAGVSHICPMGEMVLLNPDLVRQAHAAGLRLFAWWQFGETGVTNTILEAYGVDGIIVDDLRSLVDG